MARLTVLGIGNLLMRDEGLGVRLVEAVRAARNWPIDVEFIDGGVGGLNLLNIIEQAERLVVFDAAEMGLKPAEFRVFTPEDVTDAAVGQAKMSLHEVPFLETLELCERFFRRPPTVIMGVQPGSVEPGGSLSQALVDRWGELTAAAEELVERTYRELTPEQ